MAEISSNGPRLSGFWGGTVPGELIYATNFSDPPGLNGFTPLMDVGPSPRPPIAPVCFPALCGTYSLWIPTAAVGIASKDGFGEAILRLTELYDGTRIYGWDAWFAVGSADTTNAPQQVQFGFDVENRAGGSRWLPQWRYALINPSNGNPLNQIQVVNDAGTFVQATDRQTGAGITAPYVYNQNKLNMVYMGGRWSPNAGYQSAWLWDQSIDLTGQTFGSGTTSTATFFSGGFNWIAAIYNRSASHLAQAWLVVGQVRIWLE